MSRGIKERTERKKANRDKRPYAIARYIRIPNSKVKFVLDLIRGKSYEDAANILKNLNKSASPVVLKVLNSAAANAENNLAMSKDNLFVAECYATNAPQMKRMMPRARGRADRILKRSCHITVRLDEVKVGQKDVKKAAGKTVAQKAETATTAKTAAAAAHRISSRAKNAPRLLFFFCLSPAGDVLFFFTAPMNQTLKNLFPEFVFQYLSGSDTQELYSLSVIVPERVNT